MKIAEINVLVVEDDGFQRQLIVNMLHTLGASHIEVAGNGQQALTLLRDASRQPVDLVLCDLNMPEMDGLEFLRHLSGEMNLPAVVIASALEEKLLTSASKMARMYGIRLLGSLAKPITLEQLRQLLQQSVVQGQKWQHPADSPRFTLAQIQRGIAAGEFEPFFQAKADFQSGRVVGAEALARWRHPELGVLAPSAFIPVLEQQGAIDVLTFIMLEKSAAACRQLHELGRMLTLSVNLSLKSLNDPSLGNRIIQIVRQAGVDPHYIVLEITESAAMTELAPALENLTRLGMHGFVLSIDDYGTGYSSMQQLTRIAFGELKIDQSFVRDFAENPALRIIVESSIDMAHKLQVKSVAEGVETQKDWDLLKEAGCDTAQGYFISKPLPPDDFMRFLTQHKPVAVAHGTKLQSKPKVLVVDDDDFTRKIILRVLRDLGYAQTMEAASVAAALHLLEAHTFDLVLTDIDMPVTNGLKFVQLIRTGATHARADLRIIVQTGTSSSELLGIAMALDINGFLVKPVVPVMLDEKIIRAMTEKQSLRSPLAYQAITTELGIQSAPDSAGAPIAKSMISRTTPPVRAGGDTRRVLLSGLRPGMTLQENIWRIQL